MTALKTIKTRKSPEAFLSAPVDRETLQTILEAGAYAPIFGRIHFTLIENGDLLRQIDETAVEMMKCSENEFARKVASTPGYLALRNASAAVVLSAPGGNDANGFNMANVSCAAENMLLAATQLGVGSRFVMGPIMALSRESIKSALQLPQDYSPLVMVLLGHVDSLGEERSREVKNINYV